VRYRWGVVLSSTANVTQPDTSTRFRRIEMLLGQVFCSHRPCSTVGQIESILMFGIAASLGVILTIIIEQPPN
jgi:hypothetical protein